MKPDVSIIWRHDVIEKLRRDDWDLEKTRGNDRTHLRRKSMAAEAIVS